jgi:hypothetical protein
MYPNATTIPTITAGRSIGNLYIGLDKKHALSIMGSKGIERDFEEERTIFANFGYVPEEHAQFVIGFDSLWQYQESDAINLPIFKIYFKAEKIVYMIISSYGSQFFDYERCKRIITERGLGFGDDIEKMKRVYGEEFLRHNFGQYDGDFLYEEEGISFVFDAGELRVIYLFESDNQEIITNFRETYKQT